MVLAWLGEASRGKALIKLNSLEIKYLRDNPDWRRARVCVRERMGQGWIEIDTPATLQCVSVCVCATKDATEWRTLCRCPNEQFNQLIEAELMAIDFVWRPTDRTVPDAGDRVFISGWTASGLLELCT